MRMMSTAMFVVIGLLVSDFVGAWSSRDLSCLLGGQSMTLEDLSGGRSAPRLSGLMAGAENISRFSQGAVVADHLAGSEEHCSDLVVLVHGGVYYIVYTIEPRNDTTPWIPVASSCVSRSGAREASGPGLRKAVLMSDSRPRNPAR